MSPTAVARPPFRPRSWSRAAPCPAGPSCSAPAPAPSGGPGVAGREEPRPAPPRPARRSRPRAPGGRALEPRREPGARAAQVSGRRCGPGRVVGCGEGRALRSPRRGSAGGGAALCGATLCGAWGERGTAVASGWPLACGEHLDGPALASRQPPSAWEGARRAGAGGGGESGAGSGFRTEGRGAQPLRPPRCPGPRRRCRPSAGSDSRSWCGAAARHGVLGLPRSRVCEAALSRGLGSSGAGLCALGRVRDGGVLTICPGLAIGGRTWKKSRAVFKFQVLAVLP